MESIEAYMKRAVDETASDLFVVAGQTVSMKKEGGDCTHRQREADAGRVGEAGPGALRHGTPAH